MTHTGIKFDDFRFIKYVNTETSRFAFWLILQDSRNNILGTHAKKELIKFFETVLGPLGERWTYARYFGTVIIKLDREVDATMIMLNKIKH